MTTSRTLGLLATLALVLGACPDEGKRIGDTCGANSECTSGVCGDGKCLNEIGDEDGDGLINILEVRLGSNVFDADSDGDGVPDGQEVDGITKRDTDGDGIPDFDESLILDADNDCVVDQLDPNNDTPGDNLELMLPKVCPQRGVCADTTGFTVVCDDAAQGATCDGSAVSGWEADEVTCDGLDNDCDGEVDEGAADVDEDGIADCIDDDLDGDNVADATDNCPGLSNAAQTDLDGDGAGDACDTPEMPVVASVTPTLGGTTTPVVRGTADAKHIITLFATSDCTGAELGSAAAGPAGNFTGVVDVPENQETTIYALSTNSAGLSSQCSSTSATYTHDSAAPTDPTVGQLLPESPSNIQTVSVSGTAEAGGTLWVYSNSACTFTVTTTPVETTGDFTFSLEVPANKTSTFWAQVADEAGNKSQCVELFTFTHDDIAPAAPSDVVATPVSPAPSTAPEVSGAAEDGATVEVFLDDACTAPAAATVTATATGFTANLTVPANAVSMIYGVARDAAGNESACTWLATYESDDTPPATPDLTGHTPAGWTAGNVSVVFDATTEAGAMVGFYSDSTCSGAAVATGMADETGAVADAVTLPTSSGLTVWAKATDAAGNESGCSTGSTQLVGNVTVMVRSDDKSGAPLEGAWVFASFPDGSVEGVTQTDVSGAATIEIVTGSSVTGLYIYEGGEAHTVFLSEPGDTLDFEFYDPIGSSNNYYLDVTLPAPLPVGANTPEYLRFDPSNSTYQGAHYYENAPYQMGTQLYSNDYISVGDAWLAEDGTIPYGVVAKDTYTDVPLGFTVGNGLVTDPYLTLDTWNTTDVGAQAFTISGIPATDPSIYLDTFMVFNNRAFVNNSQYVDSYMVNEQTLDIGWTNINGLGSMALVYVEDSGGIWTWSGPIDLGLASDALDLAAVMSTSITFANMKPSSSTPGTAEVSWGLAQPDPDLDGAYFDTELYYSDIGEWVYWTVTAPAGMTGAIKLPVLPTDIFGATPTSVSPYLYEYRFIGSALAASYDEFRGMSQLWTWGGYNTSNPIPGDEVRTVSDYGSGGELTGFDGPIPQ